MNLDGVLERNKAFVAGRRAAPLPPPDDRAMAVVACYDPRLDDLIRPALGVAPGDVILIRTAGVGVQPTGDPLRSLTLATYLFGVGDVIVMGHTSCRMAAFEASPFIDAFRRRGVAREAFGADDLRHWVGAIASPADGVRQSVAVIRSAPMLPRDLVVAGVVLDDTTGALTVVVRPEDPVEGFATPPAATPPASVPEAARAAAPDGRRSLVTPPPVPAPGELELAAAMRQLREFVAVLESKKPWRRELDQVRARLAREADPAARVATLRQFLGTMASGAKEVIAAFELADREAASPARRLTRQDLIELFRPPARKDDR